MIGINWLKCAYQENISYYERRNMRKKPKRKLASEREEDLDLSMLLGAGQWTDPR